MASGLVEVKPRTVHTGHDLLTDRQRQCEPDRSRGKQLTTALIESVNNGVPTGPARDLKARADLAKRAEDVLAYFDRPGTSNGPTKARDGRLEHLRGSALRFR